MHLPTPSLIWISKSCRDSLFNETRNKLPNETGGILLGYWAGHNEVVIKSVIGPGSNAVHGPTRFIPDYNYHVNEVAGVYEESSRIYGYLGDWHSHPYQVSAELSKKDRKTIRRISLSKEARAPFPIMMIVYGSEDDLRIKSWIGITSKNFFFDKTVLTEASIKLF